MNRIIIGIVVVVVLLVGGLFAVPAFVDFNEYKAEIGERVSRATGRQITIDGDIDLRLLPAPALAVDGLSLGSIPGATVPEMVRIASLEVRIALLPLIGGDIQVEKIRFVEPVVVLETMADGRENWRFDQGPAAAAEAKSPAPDGAVSDLDNIRIDQVEVVDGTVTLVRAGQTVISMSAFEGEVSAATLAGPFKVAGTGVVGGQAMRFDAGVGRLDDGASIPLTANVALADDTTRIQFSGSASQANIDATVRGTFRAEGDRLGRAMAGTLAALAKYSDLPVWLDQPFSMRTDVDVSVREASLNDISLKFGETVATGAISSAYGEGLTVDAALKIKRVDLDAWFPPSTAGAGGQPGTAAGGSAPAAPALAMIAVPADLDGSLSLEIDAISWRQNVVRQVLMETVAGGGVITLKRLSALAPGGSDISLAGALSNDPAGTAAFDGTVEASSDNLRALLNWLGMDVGQVPADRLRNIQLMATVRATPDVIQAYGMDLRVDSSRFVGGLAYALRARPSFGVDFKVDRFNADAYLGESAGAGEAGKARTASPGQAVSPSADVTSSTAFLNAFDANIKISADSLTYAGLPARGVELDASLIGGELEVRRLTVGNLAGVALGATVGASGFGGNPSLTLNGVLRSNDLSGVARLLAIEPPFPVQSLGATEAKLRADGTLQDINFALEAVTGPATVSLSGRTRPLAPTDSVNLEFALEGQNLSRLLALFGTDLANDTPYRLAGTLTGAQSTYDLAMGGTVSGADIALSSQSKLTGGGFAHDGVFQVTHPDLTAFVQSFGVAFEPAARNLGALSVESSLSGTTDAVAFDELVATFGPLTVRGNAAVRTTGPRPRIEARLQANEILADLFLPVPTTGPKGRVRSGTEIRRGAPEPQERWSREPMDLSVLRAFDADIAIQAPALEAMGYAVAEPGLAVKLDDGILEVAKLNGRLFDGAFDMAARVDARGEPSARVDLRLTDGQLERALMQSAGINAATGTFSFDGTFDTHGTSQFDAISALNGKGRLSARDGVVRGLDMRRLSDRMQSLRKLPDYLELIAAATSQGETALHDLKGTVTVTQGVVRSNDLTATLDAAVGQAQGSVDLPRWFIDGTAEFSLTEHTNAPPIAIVMRGPLDNPLKSINARRLESFLVSRFGTDLLRKALGVKDQPAQPAPVQSPAQAPAQAPVFGAPATGSSSQQPTPPPQQQEPQDPLKQILRKGIEGVLGN